MDRTELQAALLTSLEKSRSRWLYNGVAKSVLWWLVPFGALWALGVEPLAAARAAVLPYLCMMGTTLLTVAALGWVVHLAAGSCDGR